jgi:hypothetical protein
MLSRPEPEGKWIGGIVPKKQKGKKTTNAQLWPSDDYEVVDEGLGITF